MTSRQTSTDAIEELGILCGAQYAIPGVTAAVEQAGLAVKGASPVQLVVDAPLGYALYALQQRPRSWRIVLVTTHNHCPEYVEDLWEYQPNALLAGQSLRRCLSEALSSIARDAPYRLAPGPPTTLTPRERAVLRHVALGWSNADIAAQFRISQRTVMNALTRVYDKIDTDSRADAILYYWGIWRSLDPPRIG